MRTPPSHLSSRFPSLSIFPPTPRSKLLTCANHICARRLISLCRAEHAAGDEQSAKAAGDAEQGSTGESQETEEERAARERQEAIAAARFADLRVTPRRALFLFLIVCRASNKLKNPAWNCSVGKHSIDQHLQVLLHTL